MPATVKVDKDGIITLTGVDYRTLSSILISASLYRHENPFVPDPEEGPDASFIKRNNADAKQWHADQKTAIDEIDKALRGAIWKGPE
jgi:hypothetical protein